MDDCNFRETLAPISLDRYQNQHHSKRLINDEFNSLSQGPPQEPTKNVVDAAGFPNPSIYQHISWNQTNNNNSIARASNLKLTELDTKIIPTQMKASVIPKRQLSVKPPCGQLRCYLCDTPKNDYSLIRSFSEIVCRGCVNFEGPDQVENEIIKARSIKASMQVLSDCAECQRTPQAHSTSLLTPISRGAGRGPASGCSTPVTSPSMPKNVNHEQLSQANKINGIAYPTNNSRTPNLSHSNNNLMASRKLATNRAQKSNRGEPQQQQHSSSVSPNSGNPLVINDVCSKSHNQLQSRQLEIVNPNRRFSSSPPTRCNGPGTIPIFEPQRGKDSRIFEQVDQRNNFKLDKEINAIDCKTRRSDRLPVVEPISPPANASSGRYSDKIDMIDIDDVNRDKHTLNESFSRNKIQTINDNMNQIPDRNLSFNAQNNNDNQQKEQQQTRSHAQTNHIHSDINSDNSHNQLATLNKITNNNHDNNEVSLALRSRHLYQQTDNSARLFGSRNQFQLEKSDLMNLDNNINAIGSRINDAQQVMSPSSQTQSSPLSIGESRSVTNAKLPQLPLPLIPLEQQQRQKRFLSQQVASLSHSNDQALFGTTSLHDHESQSVLSLALGRHHSAVTSYDAILNARLRAMQNQYAIAQIMDEQQHQQHQQYLHGLNQARNAYNNDNQSNNKVNVSDYSPCEPSSSSLFTELVRSPAMNGKPMQECPLSNSNKSASQQQQQSTQGQHDWNYERASIAANVAAIATLYAGSTSNFGGPGEATEHVALDAKDLELRNREILCNQHQQKRHQSNTLSPTYSSLSNGLIHQQDHRSLSSHSYGTNNSVANKQRFSPNNLGISYATPITNSSVHQDSSPTAQKTTIQSVSATSCTSTRASMLQSNEAGIDPLNALKDLLTIKSGQLSRDRVTELLVGVKNRANSSNQMNGNSLSASLTSPGLFENRDETDRDNRRPHVDENDVQNDIVVVVDNESSDSAAGPAQMSLQGNQNLGLKQNGVHNKYTSPTVRFANDNKGHQSQNHGYDGGDGGDGKSNESNSNLEATSDSTQQSETNKRAHKASSISEKTDYSDNNSNKNKRPLETVTRTTAPNESNIQANVHKRPKRTVLNNYNNNNDLYSNSSFSQASLGSTANNCNNNNGNSNGNSNISFPTNNLNNYQSRNKLSSYDTKDSPERIEPIGYKNRKQLYNQHRYHSHFSPLADSDKSTRALSKTHSGGTSGATSSNTSDPIRCHICCYSIGENDFVQCPSIREHKFCFPCSKSSIQNQQAENSSNPRNSDAKGMRCLIHGGNIAWTFMANEIETIFRASRRSPDTIRSRDHDNEEDDQNNSDHNQSSNYARPDDQTVSVKQSNDISQTGNQASRQAQKMVDGAKLDSVASLSSKPKLANSNANQPTTSTLKTTEKQATGAERVAATLKSPTDPVATTADSQSSPLVVEIDVPEVREKCSPRSIRIMDDSSRVKCSSKYSPNTIAQAANEESLGGLSKSSQSSGEHNFESTCKISQTNDNNNESGNSCQNNASSDAKDVANR